MGDRRVGDRREKEKGIIRIRFKDAVKYAIIGIILVISIVTNIVLALKLKKYKNLSELYLDLDSSLIYGESIDIDEIMNNINLEK